MKILRQLGLASLALAVALTLLAPRRASAGSGMPQIMPDNPPGDHSPVGSGDPDTPSGGPNMMPMVIPVPGVWAPLGDFVFWMRMPIADLGANSRSLTPVRRSTSAHAAKGYRR